MNNLHLHAVRRHAADTLHPRKAFHRGLSRSGQVVPVCAPRNEAALPLRAQWFRNTVSGALECRWISEVPAELQPRASTVRPATLVRMHRHAHRADMRPPSRKYANG